MRTLVHLLLASSAAFVTACGDTEKDADSTDTDTTTDADLATDATTDDQVCGTSGWSEQDGASRGEWMAACVSPAMMATFQAHDPVRYANFGCATCHATASTGDFAMPSLAPLDWSDMASWEPGYFAGDGSGFMEGVLVQMAGILEQEPFDPTTNTGEFGCNSCHMP